MPWAMQLPDGRARLQNGTYVIGRSSRCNIVLTDMTVSGRHAQLTVSDREATLTDLGSRNGTTVDGASLSPQSPRKLPPSCSVAFGECSTTIRYEEESAPRKSKQAPQQRKPAEHEREPERPKARDRGDRRRSASRSQESPRARTEPYEKAAPPRDRQGHVSPGEYRSYFGQAVLVLVLYWVLYLPGLIANLVYLHDASRFKQRTGQNAEGVGCLWALLWFFFLGPICVGIIIGLMLAAGALQL